jgi:tyrosinase
MPDDQSNPESTGRSRHERVKQILDKAAGDAHPSYQGYDRFWNLPHAQFLQVTLYGIRMIAPPSGLSLLGAAPAKSCCHGPAEPAPAATPQPGRGAASGLIKGLKGQPPFDGSQFPKLPWGGSPVSYDDIAFIEQWIDDGCPENDAPAQAAAAGSDRMATLRGLASGSIAHPLHPGPVNQFQQDAGKIKIRKNIDYLTADELQRFRKAVAQMKSLDQYQQDERSFGYWARIHANQCQHSWEQFLTWHRAYLYFFEQQLQDIDPTVTLPYWDWASYRADLEASIADMGSTVALDNGIIPEAYRCWIDQPGLDELKAKGLPQAVLDKLATVLNQKFDSGNRLFLKAGIQWADDPQSDRAIVGALEKINPLWHYQRWPGGEIGMIFEAYPRPDDVDRILQLDNFFSFGSGPADNHFFGALENIHNLIHNFSGGINPNFGNSTEPMNPQNPQNGDMVNSGRTAFDPIFWGHHANCDRLWAEWQKLHTNLGPDDPADVLAPWNMTVADTYSTAKLGYQYMQASHVFPASSQVPIARFVSAPAAVNPKVTATHRRAEVRLDRVQYVTRAGFFIRVFLNQPEANSSTPAAGNPHYVGMLNMFTGLCIGGPGHCEPPSVRQPRKFDHRPRQHKTPAAFRIDATSAVARLKALGETDFQVTLVVLNIDGSPATDALHLEGVSLNFFD